MLLSVLLQSIRNNRLPGKLSEFSGNGVNKQEDGYLLLENGHLLSFTRFFRVCFDYRHESVFMLSACE